MGEPKGNPSQWKRKFFKVILMSASCCFHHSGQEMSLGLVTLKVLSKAQQTLMLFSRSPLGQATFHHCPYFRTSFDWGEYLC